jgi:hypothetical protein
MAHHSSLGSFMNYDLGYIDLQEKTLQPLQNPFGPKVQSMCPVRSVTYVSEPDLWNLERAMGIEPTSEAWEGLNKTLKAIELVALSFPSDSLSWKLNGN